MSNRAIFLVLAWVGFFVGCFDTLDLSEETTGLAGATTSSSGSPGGAASTSTGTGGDAGSMATTGTGGMATTGTGGAGGMATTGPCSGGTTTTGTGGADGGSVGLLWAQQFGDGLGQTPYAVAVDIAGNVIVAGVSYDGWVDFGGMGAPGTGTPTIVVLKLKATGQYVWSKGFPISSPDNPFTASPVSVAVDVQGNMILAGLLEGSMNFGGGALTATGSVFVAKLDPNGNHMWSKQFGTQASPNQVAADGEGNIILVGAYSGSIDFGGGAGGGGPLTNPAGSTFVAKLHPDGTEAWSWDCGGDPGNPSSNAVAVDGAGSVYVAGSFSGTIDACGGHLMSTGPATLFVAKLDAGGNRVWGNAWGGAGCSAAPAGVAVDAESNVLVTGALWGSTDLCGSVLPNGNDSFAAKLDASGGHLWSKTFGALGNIAGVQGTFGAVDGQGNLWLTGNDTGTADFGGGPLVGGTAEANAFVARLTNDGGYLWAQDFGSNIAFGAGIATDSGGNAVVVGSFKDQIDFGAGPLVVPTGGSNMFVAKFSP
jgi:hypothetical protein